MIEASPKRPVPALPARAAAIAALDVVAVAVSYFLALLLRFDFTWSQIPPGYVWSYLMLLPGTLILVMGLLWLLRLYHSIWSFASLSELVRLLICWVIVTVVLPIAGLIAGIRMPASYWLVGALLGFASTTGIRFSYRLARVLRARMNHHATTYVVVVGAGEAARALIREMKVNVSLGMDAVAVLDDNPNKHGRYIEGVPIAGSCADVAEVCTKYHADEIDFAIPSASVARRREILDACTATGLTVRAIPSISQLVSSQVSVKDLKGVRLEDLLGRDPIVTDAEEVRSSIEGKVVLVTGGGGSIGSELCRQVAKDDPARLVIFDIYENNAYAIEQELRHTRPQLDLVVLIGSVRDTRRVADVFATYHPDVVFHAAAHKHVPLMEASPLEAIKNNVLGTRNVARAAAEHGASRFVLISTDKAVNPTNVMGATKRLCEMVVQVAERRARVEGAPTTYSAVRFGNVLGSNGSVVPLFERQIADGGPVTVTDPRVTRYFMTIPEAVSLVLQSACYAEGGEVFVLDMGEPVRIDDMARKLIRLSGHEPDVDIRIEYVGLRPGEKLYEERLMGEEGLRETKNRLISVARPMVMDDEAFHTQMERLEEACKHEDTDVRVLLSELVPTYHPEMAGVEAEASA